MRFALGLTPLLLTLACFACGESIPPVGTGGSDTGGALGTGGAGTGGPGTGGVIIGTGGAATGGAGTGGAATGGVGTGGAGTGGTAATLNCNQPETLPRTYAAVLQCVIKPGCATSICHGGTESLLLIDTWENFPRRPDHSTYDTLADTLLNQHIMRCADSPLVDPGHPENSALIKALSRACEDPEWGMPDGCHETPCAPQGYLDFIGEWIAMGAVM